VVIENNKQHHQQQEIQQQESNSEIKENQHGGGIIFRKIEFTGYRRCIDGKKKNTKNIFLTFLIFFNFFLIG
jgi:hypothetical protein